MSDEYRIKVGDQVTVGWAADSLCVTGVVRYVPTSEGDCWILENDNGVTYVQQFETIFKRKP